MAAQLLQGAKRLPARSRGATRERRERAPIAWGRLLRLSLLAIGSALTAACLVVAVDTVRKMDFPVRKVAIHGPFKHVERQQLVGVIEPFTAVGFFAVDLDGIKTALESMDWVYGASVRRVWPDGLAITITEQAAIARWGDRALINRAGQVFSPRALGDLAGLPRLSGPDRNSATLMHNYREFTQLLRPLGLPLSALDMDAKGAFTVYVAGGVPIVLGSQQIMEKMQRFARAYQVRLASNFTAIERVDLRYANGLAVKWRHQEQVLPAASQLQNNTTGGGPDIPAAEEQTSSP